MILFLCGFAAGGALGMIYVAANAHLIRGW